MKKLSLIFVFSIGTFVGKVHSQPGSTICGIYFDYDAVGNRIKRVYDCKPIIIDEDHPPYDESKRTSSDMVMTGIGTHTAILVYPNPTSGVFTIKLSEVPKEPVHFHWYSEQLQILGSGQITEATFSGDISGWADGVYILRVYEGGKAHAFKVVKVTSTAR